jgi:SAM-dependent methyltransferase
MSLILKTNNPRDWRDFYATPLSLTLPATKLISNFLTVKNPRILDPGCGTGHWGFAVKNIFPTSNLIGVDRFVSPDSRFSFNYDYLFLGDDFGDYRDFPETKFQFDLIIGNPPYSLAEDFIWKSFRLINKHAWLMFLLPVQFICGQRKHKKFWSAGWSPRFVYNLPRRPSFTNNKKTDNREFALYIWYVEENANFEYKGQWLDWDYDKNLYAKYGVW